MPNEEKLSTKLKKSKPLIKSEMQKQQEPTLSIPLLTFPIPTNKTIPNLESMNNESPIQFLRQDEGKNQISGNRTNIIKRLLKKEYFSLKFNGSLINFK